MDANLIMDRTIELMERTKRSLVESYGEPYGGVQPTRTEVARWDKATIVRHILAVEFPNEFEDLG